MTRTREEYLDEILDHYENPHHRYALEGAHVHGSGGNPGCGDLVTLYARLGPDGRIAEASFEGEGCTISQSAASMLTDVIEGKTLDEVQAMDYEAMIDLMGREVVMPRIRCATLALSTLKAAVRDYQAHAEQQQPTTTSAT